MTEIYYRPSKQNNHLENSQIFAFLVYVLLAIVFGIIQKYALMAICLFLTNIALNRIHYYRIRRHQNTQFEIMNSTINEINKNIKQVKLNLDKVNRK